MDSFGDLLARHINPFLPLLGILALAVWWKRIAAFLQGPEPEMIERVIRAFEENAKANTEVARALENNGSRLDQLATEIKTVAQNLDRSNQDMRAALVDIHRRIDAIKDRA